MNEVKNKPSYQTNYEDVLFGVWLGENGWQPYDGWDRWIFIKTREVENIETLYQDYKQEKSEE